MPANILDGNKIAAEIRAEAAADARAMAAAGARPGLAVVEPPRRDRRHSCATALAAASRLQKSLIGG